MAYVRGRAGAGLLAVGECVMKLEKISGWKTEDGCFWTVEKVAQQHAFKLKLQQLLKDYGCSGQLEEDEIEAILFHIDELYTFMGKMDKCLSLPKQDKGRFDGVCAPGIDTD